MTPFLRGQDSKHYKHGFEMRSTSNEEHEKKNPGSLTFHLKAWLFNRDPCFMAYEITPHNWVVFHPL